MLPTGAMANPCPMEMCKEHPPKKVERRVDEQLLVGAGAKLLWEKENGKSFRHDWISGKIPPGEGRGRSIEVNWVMGKAEREKEKSPLTAPGTCHDCHDLFCSESPKSLICTTHSGQLILPLQLNWIFNFFCHFLWRMGVKFGHTAFEFWFYLAPPLCRCFIAVFKWMQTSLLKSLLSPKSWDKIQGNLCAFFSFYFF